MWREDSPSLDADCGRVPSLLFFPLDLPSPAAEISSSLYWESEKFAKTSGLGGEGDEDGEGHGVQKPGGCEGKT